MNKKALVINLTSNIISFIVSFGISFVISPIIISSLGKEAYGFFSLGNQFVSYAMIISTALNSMASRFVALKLHANQPVEANKYFSSCFFSNVILSIVLIIPLTLIVCFIEVLLSVPADIVSQVQILWALLFGNFLLALIVNVFNIATYAKNKLYLNSLSQIIGNILKAVTLATCFLVLTSQLWYIGMGALLFTVFVGVSNFAFTKKLAPELSISYKNFDKRAVKDLLSSGGWNSVSQIAGILNTGLTLLIINLAVGASSMGDVSITKTFTSAFFQLIMLFSSVFAPQLLKIFAKESTSEFHKNIKFSMKIIGFISGMVIGIFTVFGVVFYRLWVPNENATMLQVITILELLPFYFCGSIAIVTEAVTIKNKIKNLSISYLIAGVINIIVVLLSLLIIDNVDISFGNYSVAQIKVLVIVSITSIISVIRNLTYVVHSSSKILEFKKWFIYEEFIREFIFIGLIIAIGSGLLLLLKPATWGALVLCVFIMIIVSVMLALVVLINRNDLILIKNKLLKLRRKK